LTRSGPEPFDSPDVVRLAESQQAEMLAVYGEGGNDIGPAREASQFEPPDGLFLVVRDEDGEAVACGGIVRFDAARAELKRMYVLPDARGRGLGRLVLEELETRARAFGYTGVVLETGDQSAAALGLYRSSGYQPIPCYGVYAARELSRCLEKRLA
jgi:GNAT superfamily N-acetyltransferase